jgi:nucleolar protein 56
VQDKKLAELLNSEMGLKCVSGELYLEVFRGLRNHSIRFLSGEEASIDANRVSMANLGIGHAMARNNIQFDEKRQDKPIMNSFTLVDQMEKNLNTFSMRLRESYGWHFPELSKLITDNETYVRLVNGIGNKDNLDGVDMADLAELAGEASVADNIIDAYRTSMGNDLNEVDENSIKEFADYVLRHFQYKKELQEYLKGEMEKVAPNLTSLLGESVGARLLTYAGGLNNLSKLPASTIQILGAEKALFRALKKQGSTPKYGLLFNSSFITRAGARNKGQISRMLANKCALSARLDTFLVNVS